MDLAWRFFDHHGTEPAWGGTWRSIKHHRGDLRADRRYFVLDQPLVFTSYLEHDLSLGGAVLQFDVDLDWLTSQMEQR